MNLLPNQHRQNYQKRLRDLPEVPELRLKLDPTERSLELSAWRTELPSPACLEVGRRLLLAQLESSEWILRRVERASFDRDRTVTRHNDVDFLVRRDAPVLVDHAGHEFWLVPVSRLHRRTMVNFAIRDEDDHVVTTPGLRLTQQLDQSMLLAVAALVDVEYTRRGSAVQAWISRFVAGDKQQVFDSMRNFHDALDGEHELPTPLREDPLFRVVVERLHRAFTLYLVLPVACGRKRLLTMRFDEPTEWRYQRPRLRPIGADQSRYAYQPNRKPLWYRPSYVAARLGLRPTRVRLQVPAAETAASYHFEATAPPGVRIVRASLLAGRPNDQLPVSVDRVVGHSPTVGLHAVEVPPGSLCRVQLDLVTPVRGLMTTLFVASWVIFAVLGSAAYHWRSGSPGWKMDQITNVVLILVTTSAGAAALVAQQNDGGVAARLISTARAFATLAMALPVVLACFLVYNGDDPAAVNHVRFSVWAVTGVALGVAITMSGAWSVAVWAESRTARSSPWDMTVDENRKPPPRDFLEAVRVLNFDSPAIGIRSGEAWHERYAWTDKHQFRAVRRLREAGLPQPGGATISCPDTSGECASRRDCRRLFDLTQMSPPTSNGQRDGAHA